MEQDRVFDPGEELFELSGVCHGGLGGNLLAVTPVGRAPGSVHRYDSPVQDETRSGESLAAPSVGSLDPDGALMAALKISSSADETSSPRSPRSPRRSATRPGATSTSTQPGPTGRRRARSPGSSRSTRTSPATTSTSSPPVEPRGRARAGADRCGAPVEAVPALGAAAHAPVGGEVRRAIVRLLAKTLSLLPSGVAEETAEEVGREYGESLAAHMSPGDSQRSVHAAMLAVADALTAHGFAAHAETHESTSTVVRDRCPFGAATVDYPVLSAMDRGMVSGLLTGLCGDAVRSTSARAASATRLRERRRLKRSAQHVGS